MTIAAGSLNTRVTISKGMTEQTAWVAVYEPKNGYTGRIGLRLVPEAVIVMRSLATVSIGSVIDDGRGRQFIAGQKTERNDRQGYNITATRLSGEPCAYTAKNGSTIACQAVIIQSSDYLGQIADVIETTLMAEIAQHALPTSPKRGDSLVINATTYLVDGIDKTGDDGVVWRIKVHPA